MSLRGVDVNQLVALRALLVHQNVTLAAREVGITQPSMSHALARLRVQFGDALLVKAGRELVLTARAKDLKPLVLEATQHIERVFGEPERFDPKTTKRIFWIAAPDNLELYVLPTLAKELAYAIDVRVCALPMKWENALRRGEVDLKIGRKGPVAEGLASSDLSEESFTCVVRSGHPVAKRPSLATFAALDHLIISPNSEPGEAVTGVFDALLRRHGLKRRIALSVPSFLVAPHIVASSDLVLTAPTRLLAPYIRSLHLRELTLAVATPTYTLTQVWAARASDDEGLRWLRQLIAQTMKQPARPSSRISTLATRSTRLPRRRPRALPRSLQ